MRSLSLSSAPSVIMIQRHGHTQRQAEIEADLETELEAERECLSVFISHQPVYKCLENDVHICFVHYSVSSTHDNSQHVLVSSKYF